MVRSVCLDSILSIDSYITCLIVNIVFSVCVELRISLSPYHVLQANKNDSANDQDDEEGGAAAKRWSKKSKVRLLQYKFVVYVLPASGSLMCSAPAVVLMWRV